MANENRIQRVASLVQTTLAKILLNEIEGFNLVTITNVSLAKDFSSAKVFVSVLDDIHAKQKVAELNEEAKHIRMLLARSKIQMRVIPELHFIYDDSTLRGNRISALIDKALKDTKP